jgi:hypothetical protein
MKNGGQIPPFFKNRPLRGKLPITIKIDKLPSVLLRHVKKPELREQSLRRSYCLCTGNHRENNEATHRSCRTP